ncbi:hypothetical protein [Acinetobacter bereziniae]|uniref:hypothetical protein n=1 Tax=Acinetobacter bereziniae TaxID=106648 RepID=UPI00148F10BB|nr:hypothetical protein [Acinetobacter bereziniae]
MNDNEELLEALESVANFMRGMGMDPRIPHDTKEALGDGSWIESVLMFYGIKLH